MSEVSMAQVLTEVAQEFGVTVFEIKSERRERRIARPRQAVMYLANQFTSRSYPQIARHIGRRDHTTIMHGTKTIAEIVEADRDVKFITKLRKVQLRLLAIKQRPSEASGTREELEDAIDVFLSSVRHILLAKATTGHKKVLNTLRDVMED